MAIPEDKSQNSTSVSDLNSQHSDLEVIEIEDMLSVTSEESEMSATELATHTDYAIVWEILNNCQEAAFGDIPSKYRDCLSIFDTKHDASETEVLTYERGLDATKYDALFQAAGATKTDQPWSLPAPVRSLSDEDALWRHNVRVADVSQVTPTAAVYLTPYPTETPMTVLRNLEDALGSESPLVRGAGPLFASAVLTSASHISPHNKSLSFSALRRYNRLATTSLLRQAHAFQIDVPIFGVLLRENLVAIHVDWYEEHDDIVSNSTFYPLDAEETDIKTWDLKQPHEAHEVAIILANLRNYTSGPYALRVRHGLESVKKPIKPWKWGPMSSPLTLSSTQLRQHHEEQAKDKMERWQKGLEISKDPKTYKAWKKKRLNTKKPGQWVGQPVCKEFLSPPSTPGAMG